MANAARVENFYCHSGTTILNVQFREATFHNVGQYDHLPQPTREEMVVSSRQAVFIFVVAALINFLQLKYQGKAESPFETHPKTMTVAIGSLFLYCFFYDAMLRSSRENGNNFLMCRTCFRAGMAIFGPLSLASISSVLFPENFGNFLYSAAILCSHSQFSCAEIKWAWNWMNAAMENGFCQQNQQQRRRRRIVSVRVPWFPQYSMIGHVDFLPPV